MSKFFVPPVAGDIVWCRFPQDQLPRPGPKARPALVLRVESLAARTTTVVVVAYGTSKRVGHLLSGEFAVASGMARTGLTVPTKFNLFNSARLAFDDEWFAVPPGAATPVMGKIQLQEVDTQRRFQAAIDAVRAAGGFAFLDTVSRG